MVVGAVFGNSFAPPSTIPEDGFTVTQRFTGENCTGDYTLDDGNGLNTTAGCSQTGMFPSGTFSSYESATFTCSVSTGVVQTAYINPDSFNCDASTLNSRLSVPVDQCVRANDAWTALRCSRRDAESSAPLVVPQPVSMDAAPTQSLPSGGCNVTAGCGANYATMRLYSNPDCSSEVLSAISPFGFAVPIFPALDTCYISGNMSSSLNIKATCAEGLHTISWTTGGCGPSADPHQALSLPTDKCIYYEPGKYGIVSCGAQEPSAPIEAPVSNPFEAPTSTPVVSPIPTPVETPDQIPTQIPSSATGLYVRSSLFLAIFIACFLL